MKSIYYSPSSVIWVLLFVMFLPFAVLGQTKLIWADLSGKISKANPDGSGIEQILSRHVPLDLLANETDQKVYWTESGTNSIWRVGLSGGSHELVYKADGLLQGLSLDQNKLYCIKGATIIRMNVDGSQVETIVTQATNAKDVSLVNGQAYWTGDGKIWKQNANGKGGVVVFESLSNPNNLIYNVVDKKLYWQESCGAKVCSGVRKGNPDGTGKEVVIDEYVGGFSFDGSGSKIYCTYDIFDEIFSINTNGAGRIKVAEITSSPTKTVLLGGKLFWFDLAYGDYLYVSDLNGANKKVIATTPVYNPSRFVIDTIDKWIYWVNSHSGFTSDRSTSTSIRKSKLDGSQQQIVIPFGKVNRPYGIGIDLKNKKLYWTDTDNKGIFRSNLDGTNITKIVSDVNNPLDIIVDIDKGFLFWTDWGNNKVMRSGLNGEQPKVLAQNLSTPYGIALDKLGGYIYFGEIDKPKIKRVPTEGGKVDTVLIRPTVFDYVEGLFIDNAKGLLYWADNSNGKIYQSKLNGSSISVVMDKSSGLGKPAGVQIFNTGFIVNTRNLASAFGYKSYPNPFRSSFQIEGAKIGDQISIYDLFGRLNLHQKITTDGITNINCTGFTSGMYLVAIQKPSGQVFIEKLYKYTDE